MAARARALIAKGMIGGRPKISKGLPAGSIVKCTDNSGARELRVVQVIGYKGRLRRIPAAAVGDMVVVSVKKGTPDMKKKLFRAVIVRQRKPYRRPEGVWIQFEDNAAVIMTPEGEMRGSEIRGPVGKEAAERWPRIASAASIII
ncbi:50S ribosomal protein L14 [Candidatus Bathyarchaeota archaeon]|nr:50S ribosomal protein L14 [Candidatus Bathyarchaeota archaeon]NIU80674.1 50S ribosomal protein L14 [Candidatus Bathyarchaeota archaeon]NIV67295.1 50S ribosomal protein L14 [Candidatus Bathyarchaeota archaeon]NIW15856.1 50S ribosomal protein L14 [Candidatus Bathyarchaeota archaeon]NIW33967.1 50S ribosomal protein L14 [Candidatus Bathyarchaeota archaeon]